jgi:sporulation protein YtfJ
MTTELSSATDDAQLAAEGRLADRFMERLVDRIGGRAGVQAAFGEPIERDGLTVIPVARVRWGFGGGAGSVGDMVQAPGSGSGSGGGGGVAVDAIGYLEIGPGGATFQPIVQPHPSPFFLLASGVAAAIVLRALARLVRR